MLWFVKLVVVKFLLHSVVYESCLNYIVHWNDVILPAKFQVFSPETFFSSKKLILILR